MQVMITTFAALSILVNLVSGAANLPPIPKDKTTPIHQRVALTSPGVISLGWNTYEKLNKPCVQYGLTSGKLDQTSCSSSSVTYPTSRTYFNTVRLSNLKSATKYYYKIVSTNSTQDFFQTARSAGDKTEFTMAALADLGVVGKGNGGYSVDQSLVKKDAIPQVDPALDHTTISALANAANDYEFIIHPGDFAYADDWYETPAFVGDEKNAYEAIVENFYEQLAPISGRKIYQSGPGNHEADCIEVNYHLGNCPEGQYNFTDYNHRFGSIMPSAFPSTSKKDAAKKAAQKARSLAQPPFWYSFDYGSVHYIMYDTETDFPSAPDGPGTDLNAGNFGAAHQQTNFIEADLQSVDRTITPWVIAAGHRPYVTTGSSCDPCQKAFEGLFYKYGVDVVVNGHVHNLQWNNPIYNNTVDSAGTNNPKAPAYACVGGAGNIEGHSGITGAPASNKFAYNKTFGFGLFTFHNATHLGVNFINSVDGSSLYKTTLYKAHKDQFVSQ